MLFKKSNNSLAFLKLGMHGTIGAVGLLKQKALVRFASLASVFIYVGLLFYNLYPLIITLADWAVLAIGVFVTIDHSYRLFKIEYLA